MKTLIAGILLSFVATTTLAKTFGEEFTAEKTSSMTEVLKDTDKYQNQEVIVSATVDKVCKMKGCWFEVKTDDALPTKVVFKDYSFFVPKDIDGKEVVMKGHLKRKKLSVKEQRHYLKDAGASEAEIQAVKNPKMVFQFVASGVKI